MKKTYTNNCIQKNIRCAKGTIVWLLFTLIIATGLVAFMLYITDFFNNAKTSDVFLFCFSITIFFIQATLFIRCIWFKISLNKDKIIIRMFLKKIVFRYDEFAYSGFIRDVKSNGIFDFYSHRNVDVLYLSTEKIDSCVLNKKLNKKFYVDFGILKDNGFYIADTSRAYLDRCFQEICAKRGQICVLHKDELSRELSEIEKTK